MFSGGVSRAVNYTTHAGALGFVAADPSMAMELTPIGVAKVRGPQQRFTIETVVSRQPATAPLKWESIWQFGPPSHVKFDLNERFSKNGLAGKMNLISLGHTKRGMAPRVDKAIAELHAGNLSHRPTSEQNSQFIGDEHLFLTQARDSTPI